MCERDALLTLAQVEEMTNLSRNFIYVNAANGEFPKPRRIGAKASRWLLSEITAWMHSLPEGSDASRIKHFPQMAGHPAV